MAIADKDQDKAAQKAASAREAALNGALTQIERQFGKGSIMKMGSDEAALECATHECDQHEDPHVPSTHEVVRNLLQTGALSVRSPP